MPLTIIKGPPNSGRTDELERRYLASIPKRPVLVVPGVDDIFDWERRLTRSREALLGGQIVHFRDLYTEILLQARSKRLPVASELHRLHLIRQAIATEWKAIADRLEDQPGMAAALLALIDDFRAEMMDPIRVGENASEHGRHLGPLAELYRRYLELLEQAELTDLPAEASAAVALSTQTWSSRPVMIAGFDELTRQQLELVRRLAFDAGVDVTVAVTFEPDNPALDLTATLVGQLKSLGPSEEIKEIDTSRDGGGPHASLLVEIQERFLRPDQPGDLVADEDQTVMVMRSAGSLNEAEAIAARIARLVSGGTDPSEIAIAVESPAENGVVIAETLERFGIPGSLESETRVASTVTGASVIHLLEAERTGSVDDLIAFLRNPAGPGPEVVDRLELECRIDGAASAVDALGGTRSGLDGSNSAMLAWFALQRKEDPVEIFEKLVPTISAAILANDRIGMPSNSTVIEVRAAEAIARACEEIGKLMPPRQQSAAILEAISAGTVKVWSVPAQGTVRIGSPYSLRAKRVEHLFCAALQEAPLSDSEKAEPFLSARDRSALGMSERRDPEIQQRYLFYSSLTVPTRSLCLSCRVSDETGSVEHPSPLIQAVENLFARDGNGRPRVATGGKLGSNVVFPAGEAPTSGELARAVAASPVPLEVARLVPDLGGNEAARLQAAVAAAADAEQRTRSFGDLSETKVETDLGEHPVFAATDLEAYATCPYRWFIERQIQPQPFEPDPDYLAMGTLVHNVLEEIYEKHPGEIPQPETIGAWLAQVPGLVEKHAADGKISLASDSVSHAALRRRAVLLIETHLRRESRWENPAHIPWQLEIGIGTRNSEIEAVDMGNWSLKGKIDRIDLSPESATGVPREAVVVDYKTGTVDGRSHHKASKDRRVQVQLYLHALREIWGLNPVAGIYVPVRLGGEKSRGAFLQDDRIMREMKMRGVSERDKVEDLDNFIESGLATARISVQSIVSGALHHDPSLCPDHFEHPAVRHTAETKEEEEFLNRSFV